MKNRLTAHTKILCILGHPITHSMSPLMHNIALQDLDLDYAYIAFDVAPSNLKGAIKGLKALNVRGINVTIPYKEKVMPYLDRIDSLAEKIGAVNTIKLDDDLFLGKNTDAEGAIQAINNAGINFSGKDVLLIGSGGAAKAISYALIQNVNKLTILNKTEQNAVKLANRLKKDFKTTIWAGKLNKKILGIEIETADILINATPVGMYPYINESVVPKEILHKDLFVFDLLYNPLETRLIKDAKEIGCKTLNGLEMLVNQGALAFKWWTNKTPNKDLMKKIISENLVH